MSNETIDLRCPLCQATASRKFYQDSHSRDYFRCPICRLVFVLPHQFLTLKAEKEAYDQHQNSPHDPRYRHFLSRLFNPMVQCLAPNSRGLDFGSGPGPTLSVMFAEAGHSMQIYDPFYAPNSKLLEKQYDFITASEVVEHLHHPRRELDRLYACLQPNGLLGIMTKRVIDRAAFSRWHYKNDPTHVCFFARETFRWLADHWEATLSIPANDVVIFKKGK